MKHKYGDALEEQATSPADGELYSSEALLDLLFKIQRIADHIEWIAGAAGTRDNDVAEI